jgi:hypothetical protein
VEFVEGKAKAAKDKEIAERGDDSTDEEKAAKKKKFSAERQVIIVIYCIYIHCILLCYEVYATILWHCVMLA